MKIHPSTLKLTSVQRVQLYGQFNWLLTFEGQFSGALQTLTIMSEEIHEEIWVVTSYEKGLMGVENPST